MNEFTDTVVSWGPLGVFLLSVLDSAGMPLPGGVDILLVTIATLDPEHAYWSAGFAVAGSLIGSRFLFELARKGGEKFLDRHIHSGRGQRLKEWFLRFGLVTVFIPALLVIPLPLKIPVLCAGAFGTRGIAFMLVLAAARVPRYFGLAYLGRQLGKNSMAYLKDHSIDFLLIAAGLFIFLVVLVKVAERYHRPPGRGTLVEEDTRR